VKLPELKASQLKKRWAAAVVLGGVALFFINLAVAETDRPELLTRTFDRNYIVKYLGPYNYMIYDGVQAAQNASQKAYAS
ncbi:glycerol phosphate lipoteichoic acid synthase, partial [Bacillus licheniformis]|nr:glycerol phosphate lipoteichoic acid synthase [Bacillus licheniformis]